MSLALTDTLLPIVLPGERAARFHSLPALEAAGMGPISRLPFSLRILLEAVLRHAGGTHVTEAHIRGLANWQTRAAHRDEVPFFPARIIAPDSSGIPLLADLAAMRDVAADLGADPSRIGPRLPVDLIVDHSLQVDYYGDDDALRLNMELEFERNGERYAFIKWAGQSLSPLRVAPPGTGIVHQVNMEYWAPGVLVADGVVYPDSLVGADSHTAMINGLGVLGWGVGGIEAEAAMLGQPVALLTPDVVGVELRGSLRAGVTATDAVLTLTEALRAAGVVGKFVEFFGAGAASLSGPDRATISNMAPEYGATTAFFPVDDKTLEYYLATGRSARQVETVRAYFVAQGMFGMPLVGQCDYSDTVAIDLERIGPSVAGPKRPQDRIDLHALPSRFAELLRMPAKEGGFAPLPATRVGGTLAHGDIVLAAITSCTNTSNPALLLTAALLARRALELGLRVPTRIKTSFAPGSRVVTAYLQKTGLQQALDGLGFQVVGYGCTTCIGNSGPLSPQLEAQIVEQDVVVSAVLSGNRNFEARIHPAIRANFLMSPPLVVAFALAGRVTLDLEREPLGVSPEGRPVFLRDLWPTPEEIAAAMVEAADPQLFHTAYSALESSNPLWNALPEVKRARFEWDPDSTYLRRPPFFEHFTPAPAAARAITSARALLVLGDSVTTDHISPGGPIGIDSSAGRYLLSRKVASTEFNSYIARRGNHEVMMRGTFANVRLRNRMVPGIEGGVTRHWPDGATLSVYDAAMAYRDEKVGLIVVAGEEYGTGSSRDWAAKGTRLLGVRAVVARSFERIHRSNLIGMGVLPLQFMHDDSIETLAIDGSEVFDILGVEHGVTPGQEIEFSIRRGDGSCIRTALRCRVDTPAEAQYIAHDGILPFVLRQMLTDAAPA